MVWLRQSKAWAFGKTKSCWSIRLASKRGSCYENMMELGWRTQDSSEVPTGVEYIYEICVVDYGEVSCGLSQPVEWQCIIRDDRKGQDTRRS